MKKQSTKRPQTSVRNEMLPEYDFSKGLRGKHSHAMRHGYTVKTHNDDGSTTLQYIVPSKSAVVLDTDVLKHFPDSESVNRQLRACIREKRVRSPRPNKQSERNGAKRTTVTRPK